VNGLFATAGFATAGGGNILDGFFDCGAGFARAFLNPAQQFFALAFGVSQIVIRELGPFFASACPA
jgi:hypothetical protein